MSRLFLARHANTFEADSAPYWVGLNEDIPLSSSGKAQLASLKSKVFDLSAGINPTVLSSPLRRAVSTAESFGLPIKIEARLAIRFWFVGWTYRCRNHRPLW